MKITVIGTGYVGLVSGVCFAKIGHQVICVDNNLRKIDELDKGQIPIYEPGLKEVLDEAVLNGKISFTNNLAKAVRESQAIFIAVGTPHNEIDGSADLSFVYKVAQEIAGNINDYKVIVTKSTVPVGTGMEVKNIIKKTNPKADFSVASNPEFLREGCALEDFLKPDRIVVGVEDERGQKMMGEIYQHFNQIAPVILTDITTSELIKYAANSFLAAKIAFINEVADLCEKVDADIRKLGLAVGLDSRIGGKFLNPGPGFGGSCFPKDILALENIAKKNDVELSLISSTITANKKRKIRMAEKIIAALGKNSEQNITGKTVAILGLAFKGETDDVRYSPALTIIQELVKHGVKIRAYDAQAIENTKKELGEIAGIFYFDDPYEAINSADLTTITTEWEEFRKLDLIRIKKLQKSNVIVDLRNMLDVKAVKKVGFDYIGIGTKSQLTTNH